MFWDRGRKYPLALPVRLEANLIWTIWVAICLQQEKIALMFPWTQPPRLPSNQQRSLSCICRMSVFRPTHTGRSRERTLIIVYADSRRASLETAPCHRCTIPPCDAPSCAPPPCRAPRSVWKGLNTRSSVMWGFISLRSSWIQQI